MLAQSRILFTGSVLPLRSAPLGLLPTGNNTPIFFIRDPILFPSFIHTQKRNPQTHLKDPDAFWDFISLRPETTHQASARPNRSFHLAERKVKGEGLKRGLHDVCSCTGLVPLR